MLCARGGGWQQLFAKWNQRTAAAAGEEAEVADADEATRQHMQQEATQELIHRQSQESFFVLVSGVPPAKGDLVIDEINQTVVGDGDSVRISAEVAKHLLGSAESWFAIDHPLRNKELADKAPKESGLNQTSEHAVELQLSRGVSLLQRGDEFSTEDLATLSTPRVKIIDGAGIWGRSRMM